MARTVSTGELNQKITIKIKNDGSNDYGGGFDEFLDYWETLAKAEPLKSSRTLEANQQNLRAVVRFTVRARNDKQIYSSMLVIWRDETFIIQNYTPDPTYKEFITFDAAVANIGNIMQSV